MRPVEQQMTTPARIAATGALGLSEFATTTAILRVMIFEEPVVAGTWEPQLWKFRLSLIWSQAQTTSESWSSWPRSPPFMSGCSTLISAL